MGRRKRKIVLPEESFDQLMDRIERSGGFGPEAVRDIWGEITGANQDPRIFKGTMDEFFAQTGKRDEDNEAG